MESKRDDNLKKYVFSKTSKNSNNSFFNVEGVEKRGYDTIEKRFETLLLERGLKWSDCYNHESLGLDKSLASKIRRGLIIPHHPLRIKIATFFGVDSSVIWNIPSLIQADKLKEVNQNGD